jgi:predicted metal-dependent phosphoesterase TrpH
MLIDLHCHTTPRSGCSAIGVAELIARARGFGLDAVCLTEHDALWDEEEVAALSAEHGFPVLRGVEVTTEAGHVLAFGLDHFSSLFHVAARLRAAADACGAVLVLAHPQRPGQPLLPPDARRALFDAVEGVNGSDTPAQNEVALRLAADMPLPPTGGSDCHAPAEIGRAATRLAHPVRSTAELVAELKRGQHAPLWRDTAGVWRGCNGDRG